MLSIIIATFNADKIVKQALDSVLEQTFQKWECIIVDGASKDNTVNIVKEYAQKDSRFKYISEPDNGIFDAFNKGWKIAKGEWIYYLGADDFLQKDAFKKIPFDKLSNYDVIYGDIQVVFANGDIQYRHPYHPNTLQYKMFACHQSILVKRCMLEKMNGFNIAYSTSDMLLTLFTLNLSCNSLIVKFSFFITFSSILPLYTKIDGLPHINSLNFILFKLIYEIKICITSKAKIGTTP